MNEDLLATAQRVASEVLAPGAAAVDADSVRRHDLDLLGDAGLLGVAAEPPQTFRAVQEVLAGADASTWFVQAQHHYPVRLLAGSTSPALVALRDDLTSGRRVAGVAFSHLRRWPDRPVEATAVRGGWRFDGLVPWYTGWGLNDVLALGGASAAGEVVFALAQARESESLTPTAPMKLAALSAASTVQLRVQGLVVPDEQVLLRTTIEQWRAGDLSTTVTVNPGVLGIAQAAVDRLRGLGGERGLAEATDLAGLLARRLDDVRSEAYALADAGGPADEALAHRVTALRLCLDATTAVVAAGAGGSMAMANPAQRWAREALFLVVQGQTLEARRAMLRSWADTPD